LSHFSHEKKACQQTFLVIDLIFLMKLTLYCHYY